MRNVIIYKDGEQSWVNWIKKRIKNNLNFLGLFDGPTGIGKSWSMISIAYMIDPEFEPRQIAFSFRQVMQIINSDWFNKKKWKILLFDEAQCSIGNRQWQSLTNKLMNYLLSTFRHRNIIMFFSSPYSDFLDSQTMKLIHGKFEIKGHDKEENTTQIRPKLLQYNSKLKKFYEHSLYVIRGSKYNKLVNWTINKPPKHLIIPYEKSKVEFTDKLNRDIEQELENLEGEEIVKRKKKPLTEQQQLILDLWEQGTTNQNEIARKLNRTQGYISKVEGFMRNKGYSKEKYQN